MSFNLGDLVFYAGDTVYRVEKVIRQTVTEDHIRYHSFHKDLLPKGIEGVRVGDPLPASICIAMVYDSKQKKKKLLKRARQKQVLETQCRHVTADTINEKILDLKKRIEKWETIKFEVGVKCQE